MSLGDETENNNNNNNLERNFAIVLWLRMGRRMFYFGLIQTVITETLYPDMSIPGSCHFGAGLSGKQKHTRAITYNG